MATSDRRPYLTATTLDQSFLDESFDNLVNQLELIVDIDSPIGILHLSDRNKYVDGTFYEARLQFPEIIRTVGEFLDSTLEFSQLSLEINNVDEAYNDILPSGANFDGWVGRSVSVKLGLRDVGSTYTEIFRGKVTAQGGFSRSVKSFTLTARNDFDTINKSFPNLVFKASSFPDIEPNYENVIVPIIYGDWTVNVQEQAASIPAIPVNGANVNVNGETSNSLEVQVKISDNVNVSFDSTQVYVLRGDLFYLFDSADIVNVHADNNYFEVRQSATSTPAVTIVDGSVYNFQTGDIFYVKVKGKDLGAYDDNIIEIGRDILLTYGGLIASDFDANWNTYRDKAAPSESAIANFKARAYLGEPQQVLEYVLSLFEQVRLEIFIDRNLKLKISSLHLDDFVPAPSFRVRNWDIEDQTFKPQIDTRNNFNRAQADFNFLPNIGENYESTPVFRNSAAITQIGQEISKKIVFPNLYQTADVQANLIEILKIASATIEIIELTLTWRALLLDIGDFVKLNIDIQSAQFVDVPCLIRDIGYNPNGVKIPMKLWSLQMLPFTGYNPAYSGITGGNTAIITEE